MAFQQMTLLLLLVATAAQVAVTRTVCDGGIVNDSGTAGGGENTTVEVQLVRRYNIRRKKNFGTR